MTFCLRLALSAGAMLTIAACATPPMPVDETNAGGASLSPVPAFSGGGADWSISINSVSGTQHSADLTRPGDAPLSGILTYDPQSADPASAIRLTGKLGTVAASVEISPGGCSVPGLQGDSGVTLSLDGKAPLKGCGALAVY